MSSIQIKSLILSKIEAHYLISIFIIALILRWLLLAIGFVDYWGDAQHNLIMSKLTLDNGFVYTDFKDRALTWLPLSRYWGSLIMLITGTYSLWAINVVNCIIGASTAVLAAYTGSKLLDKKLGLLIGLAAAITPYLMVFSYVGMAEVLGGFLMLAWFTSTYKEKYILALVFAFLAALTRYELIFLIGISMIPLLYFKSYKAVIYSIGGLILALGIWSWWSYTNSGNPFTWLLMRIESTTRSTGFYIEQSNKWQRNVLVPIATVLQAFPLILCFIWFKKPKNIEAIKERFWFYFMGYITLAHWIFFFVAQFKIIAYPDPRFFILTLPITIIWFFALFNRGYFRAFINQRIIFLLLAFSLIQLIVPFYRQYSLQPRKEVGAWLKEHINDEQLIWSDQAVAIVESGRDPSLFISSDKLLPLTVRGSDEQDDWILNKIEENDIQYITSYNAPFDYTQELWPQIEFLQPFEWKGVTFVPVFTYMPYKREDGSLDAILREQFEARLQHASVWRLYKN